MIKGGLLITLLSHLLSFTDVLPQSITVEERFPFAETQIVPSSDPTLSVGQIITKPLAGNSQNSYRFETRVGYVSRFDVIQKGVDVVVRIRSVDGAVIKSIDRPSGSFGRESVTFISPFDGIGVIEISAYVPETADGSYQLRFTEFRAATSSDEIRSRAEDLTSAAELARSQRPREKKEEAIGKFQDALELWKQLGDRYEQAVAQYGLGFTHYTLSSYFDAAISYQTALQLMKGLGDDFGQAINHSALGAVQYSIGELTLSAFNYRRAIDIYTKLGNKRGLGIALSGLGNAELLSGNYTAALKNLKESYRLRESANDQSGKILTGFSLVNLYLLMEDTGSARSELRRIEEMLGPDRVPNNYEFLYFSGRLSNAEGNPETARRVLSTAKDIYATVGNRLRVAQSLFELSRAHESLGELEEADRAITEAIEIVEEIRQGTRNFRARIGFTELIQPFFGQQLRVIAQRWKQTPSDTFIHRGFEAAERSRSRGLSDQLERRVLLKSIGIAPELLTREATLRDRITNALEGRFDDEEKRLSTLQNLTSEYITLEAEINKLLEVPQRAPFSIANVRQTQQALNADEALISISATSDETLVWFITNDSLRFFSVAKTVDLTTLASDAFECLSNRPKNRTSDCSEFTIPISRVLLGPIENEIGGKKIVVIKDGVFERLPFQALQLPTSGKYFVETNQIVTMPSASLLTSPATQLPGASGSFRRAAVFADPVYRTDDERLSTKYKRIQTNRESALPRLFSSRFEANRIEGLKPNDVDLFLDFDASIETLESLDFRDYSVLHFATHAVIDDRTPELSAIILSAVDRNGGELKSGIRLSDIQRFNFDAELVFLSACQTGVGKQLKGEGFISLGQSFYASGARSVIFTGWKVDDRVTAELVSRFYRSYLINGQTIATSLQEAQVSLLKDRRTSHPYYWAAFILQSAGK